MAKKAEENVTSFDDLKRKKPPVLWDEDQLEFFDINDENDIISMSKGLELSEIADFYNITIEELPPYDRWFVETVFKRARVRAMTVAVDRLFENMSGRNGQQATLAYLRRFAEKWPEEQGSQDKGIRIIME